MTFVSLPDDGKRNVFVFGSNTRGIHGAGAARFARVHYGAELGVGKGHTGDSYAIPTVDGNSFAPLPLETIEAHVFDFLAAARMHHDRVYYLTPIACGIAGYTAAEIAPLFADAPNNVVLPDEFIAILHPAPRT